MLKNSIELILNWIIIIRVFAAASDLFLHHTDSFDQNIDLFAYTVNVTQYTSIFQWGEQEFNCDSA